MIETFLSFNNDILTILLCVVLQKTEVWESEKELEDMEAYFWDINPSRKAIVDVIMKQKEVAETLQVNSQISWIQHVNQLLLFHCSNTIWTCFWIPIRAQCTYCALCIMKANTILPEIRRKHGALRNHTRGRQ